LVIYLRDLHSVGIYSLPQPFWGQDYSPKALRSLQIPDRLSRVQHSCISLYLDARYLVFVSLFSLVLFLLFVSNLISSPLFSLSPSHCLAHFFPPFISLRTLFLKKIYSHVFTAPFQALHGYFASISF